MKVTRTGYRMGVGAWMVWTVIATAFLYLALNTYALELGAVHHNAFCPEHGWAP